MAEDYVQLPSDGSGKKLRTYKHTVGEDEVHEETVQVTDGLGNVVDPRENMFTVTVSTPQDATELTVSGGETRSDLSDAIDVSQAKSLLLQVRNTDSTDLDVIVYTSPDDSVYDDLAYVSINLGANEEKSIAVTVGAYYVKVYAFNNDDSNATIVTTKLTMRV